VFPDDFEITNNVQEAGWVSAVKITPKKGKSDGKQTISYRTSAIVGGGSIENPDTPAGPWGATVPQVGEVTGKSYDVKYSVAAVKDKFNAAVDFDGGKLLVFNTLPTANKVVNVDNSTWGESGGFHFEGTAANVILSGPFGDVSGRFAFLFNNAGLDVTSALPTEIQGANTTSYPRLCIQFANAALAGPAYAGYKEAIITYDLIRCEISSADSTNMTIRRNAGTGYTTKQGDQYPDFKAGKGQTITFPATFYAANDGDGISIQKNHNETGVLLRITKIEFVTW
jgi:hypothetical protein